MLCKLCRGKEANEKVAEQLRKNVGGAEAKKVHLVNEKFGGL